MSQLSLAPTARPEEQYAAISGHAAVADACDRTRIDLVGPDRHKFLHNLCTSDILGLQPGQGRETFLCNVQGKVLAHVYVFAGAEVLSLDGVAGQSETILKHLDRYHIREKVEIRSRTADQGELLLAGPGAKELWRRISATPPPDGLLENAQVALDRSLISLRSVNHAGPGSLLLVTSSDETAGLAARLLAEGAVACSAEVVETVRLENGFPVYGRDISPDNLAQEVNRNELAISFTKGCYLGQETVARIDALGHVNRSLVGLRIETPTPPPPGTELFAEEKVVGQVTSSGYSPRLAATVALGYVRRGHNTPGTKLTCAGGTATVTNLPAG